MNYLIPFASVGSASATQAIAALHLPHLNQLMQRMRCVSTDTGDAYTLSPPHDRALAKARGLWTEDGKTPWAAHALSASGAFGYQKNQAWAQITPCYWHVGIDQIQMLNPESLQLGKTDSYAVLEAMRPYFAEDGITLHYDAPMRWFAQSQLFDGLASASLDRVVGRNVNAWMPEGAQAAPLRRLQNEMQMLLYTHAINDGRQAAGLLPVNSFWASGAGRLPAQPVRAENMQVINDLQLPALQENWPAWSAAWQHLDKTVVKDWLEQALKGESIELTLCGERAAQHWATTTPSLWQKFTHILSRPRNQIEHSLL
jgi:hypothetical protein